MGSSQQDHFPEMRFDEAFELDPLQTPSEPLLDTSDRISISLANGTGVPVEASTTPLDEEKHPLINSSSRAGSPKSPLGNCRSTEDGDANEDASRPMYLDLDFMTIWFPTLDPARSKSKPRRRTDRDLALFIQLALAVLVLITNVSLTIYGAKSFQRKDGFGELYTGDCTSAARVNTVLHLGLNVLSTLLLVASNYCAQILASPLREEVDKAHKDRDWLDIGIPSVRNLLGHRIALRRRVAWALLLLSSAMLHLTWNSAVVVTLPRNNYQVSIVTKDYRADQKAWPVVSMYHAKLQSLRQDLLQGNLTFLDKKQCIERYTDSTLALGDVIVVADNATMDMGLSQPNKTVGIIETGNTHSSLLWTDLSRHGSEWIYNDFWMCSSFFEDHHYRGVWCTQHFLSQHIEDWTLSYGPNGSIGVFSYYDTTRLAVRECYSADSRSWNQQCSVRYNLIILTIVCVLNGVKTAAIAYSWWHWSRGAGKLPIPELPAPGVPAEKHNASLVTIGDAVASFLQSPDPYTLGCSLAGRDEFDQQSKLKPPKKDGSRPGNEENWLRGCGGGAARARYAHLQEDQRWFQAASWKRWLITLSGCAATLVTVAVLMSIGLTTLREHAVPTDILSLWREGFGSVQPYATTLTSLIHSNLPHRLWFWVAVFIVNFPQLLLSALYLLLSGLFSAMLAASEWSGFIRERKTLRLSTPHGIQRSSYFLTLPYRFAIPLQTISGLLHWLISQSLFVIDVNLYTYVGSTDSTQFPYVPRHPATSTLVGYSVIGIICAFTVGCLLVIWVVATGFLRLEGAEVDGPDKKKFNLHMPLASTCSAAISAACHPPEKDNAAHLLPVLWGRVPHTDQWTFTSAKEVHLSITRRIDTHAQ